LPTSVVISGKRPDKTITFFIEQDNGIDLRNQPNLVQLADSEEFDELFYRE